MAQPSFSTRRQLRWKVGAVRHNALKTKLDVSERANQLHEKAKINVWREFEVTANQNCRKTLLQLMIFSEDFVVEIVSHRNALTSANQQGHGLCVCLFDINFKVGIPSRKMCKNIPT